MFIIFLKFHDGVTNTVQHFLVGRLLVMSFDLSCDLPASVASLHCVSQILSFGFIG